VQSHLDPRSDIGQRLPTERSLGLGDLFTRHCFDDGMVQWGKNRPDGRGPRDRRPKSRRLPNVCASVGLDPPTAPPVARPLRVPSGDTREAVKPAGNAERSDRQPSYVGLQNTPAAKTPLETRGRKWVLGQAWEVTFPSQRLLLYDG
jgi:hypothetical protein